MSKNKRIFVVSLLVTLFVLSSLMEDNRSERTKVEPPETVASKTVASKTLAPEIAPPAIKPVQRLAGCPPMSDFMMNNPDATPQAMYQVEECNRVAAQETGHDRPGTGYPGNTANRPVGSLAHYEMGYGGGFFTVYRDRIEGSSNGVGPNTIVPFTRVTQVRQGWDIPGSLEIEYISDGGNQFVYTFMMQRDDDVLKTEGARDIDRLINLLKKQHRLAKP